MYASAGPLADATLVVLPYKEQVVPMALPVGMIGQRELPFGMTDTWMCRVDHWAHILRINQIALVAAWMERGQSFLGKLWFLWRALVLGFPWRRGRLLGAVNRVHGKAFVHHTAHVELSVVEAGAHIGANAVVKSSWIGRNAKVDDGAQVNASVLADGAVVASTSVVMGAVLYPEAFAAQDKMQLAVLGEAAVAFTGSYFYDLNFQGNVRVSHRGKVVDAGERMLSVCLGPRARVAGGVWVASGREVPAGALVVQPPDGVLYKLDEELVTTRMVTVRGKEAVDLGVLPVLEVPGKD
jgi:carbonic anhydrase/acetyltransferase-like protein (isoleucine patch superfamily)